MLRLPRTEKAEFLLAAEKGLLIFSHDSDWPYLPCDELCMATTLQSDIITKSEHVYCTLELAGLHTRGQVIVDWRGFSKRPPNVLLVLEVDRKKYFELMKKTVE
jgi:inosine-uridine nucleoside N-ribohydrolase